MEPQQDTDNDADQNHDQHGNGESNSQSKQKNWQEIRKDVPVGDSQKDRKKRADLWMKFGVCQAWHKACMEDPELDRNVLPALTGKEKIPDGLDLEQLTIGVGYVFNCPELTNARQAVEKAFEYASQLNPDGDDELLEFCEFRPLLIYMHGLCDVFQLFHALDTSGDGLLELSEIEEGCDLLVENGIDIDDPRRLYEMLRGDDEFVDFLEFAHWACAEGLAGKELAEIAEAEEQNSTNTRVDVLYTVEKNGYWARCAPAKPWDPAIKDAKPPPNALLEYLQHETVDLSVITKLIRRTAGIDLDLRDAAFGWPAMLFSAMRGSVYIISELFTYKAGYLSDNHGNSPLHIACRCNKLEAVEFLLSQQGKAHALQNIHDNNVIINRQNNDGFTPLMMCAVMGHEEVADVLIEAAADINILDSEGKMASMWAAKHGHVSVMTLLLKRGFEMGFPDSDGATVMEHAKDNLDMRTILLEAERLNQELVRAAETSDTESAADILERGAYVNSRDDFGWSAMTWAFMNRSVDMIKLLAHYNADPDFIDNSRSVIGTLKLGNERKPLEAALNRAHGTSRRMLLAAKENKFHIVERELQGGARINSREERNLVTCFMYAAMNNSLSALTMLHERKADMELRDLVGWTAVHYGIQANDPETVALLIHLQCNINLSTWDQNSPVHLSSRYDNGAMIQLLAQNSCEIGAKNADAHNPLQVAACDGCGEAVTTLIFMRADVNVLEEKTKQTVLGLTVISGYRAAFDALMSDLPSEPVEICDSELLFFESVGHKRDRLKAEECQETEYTWEEQEQKCLLASAIAQRPAFLAKWNIDEEEWNRRFTAKDCHGKKVSREDLDHDLFLEGSGQTTFEEEQFPMKWRIAEEEVSESEYERNFNEDDYIDSYEGRHGPLRRAEAHRQTIIEQLRDRVEEQKLGLPQAGGWELVFNHDVEGREPLMLAGIYRQAAMVPKLLEAKAHLDHVDKEGNTPLMLAARGGSINIVMQLLAQPKTDPMTRNHKGKTAADQAATEYIRKLCMGGAVQRRIVPSGSRPPDDAPEDTAPIYRCKLQGLPPHELPDLMEDEIYGLARRLQIVPRKVTIPTECYSTRPLGWAIVDFGMQKEADKLASFKKCTVGGRSVKIIREEVSFIPS